MEKKKPVKKNTTKSKTSTKKATTKKKTVSNKKKTKGFTLIELLAVIIILGVLMIIAIPSVTTYISNSRKSSYVDTVKNLVGAARNLVNSGKVHAYDRNTTYYIPSSCLPMENGASTPYGEFTEAYVVVTYDGNGYSYYWTGTDSSHTGVKKLVQADKLTEDNIEPNVEDSDILTDVGIGAREVVSVMDKNECDPNVTPILARTYVASDGGDVQPLVMEENYEYKYNNYYYLGNRYLSNYNYLQTVENLIPVPKGATQMIVYYRNDYYDSSNYVDSGNWKPVTIKSGKYSYANYKWTFSGTDDYITIPKRSYNTMYEEEQQITNEAIFLPSKYRVPASLYMANGNINIGNYYNEQRTSVFFKFKFRGPGYQDSVWYVVGVHTDGPLCFDINTEVEVYDEKKKKRFRKKLQDLTYDDLVLVWDFDKAEFAWAKPLWIRKIDTAKSYHLVKFSDGSELKVIGEHKIFNADTNKFVSILRSKVGFNTFNSKGKLVKVVSRKLVDKKVEFTSVITNKHMNLFTNDVLTSITFNNLYKIKDMKFVKENVVKNSIDMYKGISKKYFDGLRVSEMGMKFATTDVIETIEGLDEVKK